LYVTDLAGGSEGAVYVSRLPAGLVPTGRSGARLEDGSEQEMVELDELEVFASGFEQTYRSFLWVPSI
jgi:hypothetical protein